MKSAKLYQIVGQKWQVECVKYLCRAGWSWDCHCSGCLQDRTTCIFLVCELLSQDTACQIPNLCRNLAPNVQTCSVWQSTLSTSHPMVVFQAKEYGQLVSQDFQSPDICICTAKQGGGKPRSVWGSWSNGENFLCIRRKFLLALTAICAFTAWVPCQLFFLC